MERSERPPQPVSAAADGTSFCTPKTPAVDSGDGRAGSSAPTVVVPPEHSTSSTPLRAGRVLSGLPLLMAAIANTIRLGVVDHLWLMAVVIDVVLIGSLPIVLLLIRRRDASALARGPVGTLVTARFSITTRQLDVPRFTAAKAALMRGARMTGFLTGRVFVLEDHIQLVTKDRLPEEFARIDARDLSVIELRKLPAKVNGGSLDLSFQDGTRLSIEVGQYRRLQMTLPCFGQTHEAAL